MATKLYFRDDGTCDTHLATNNAKLNGTTTLGWNSRPLTTDKGSGVVSQSTNTVTGPTSGVEIASSTPREWISLPLSADVTISGTITLNIWAEESNMSANVAINAVIEVIRANVTGTSNSNTLVQIAQTARTTELAVGAAARAVNNFTVTPTSTVVNRGDRIRVRIYGDDSAAATMATGFTFDVGYSGTTDAVDGDTWIQFNETLTFESAPGLLNQSDATGGGVQLGTNTAEQQAQLFVSPGNMLTEVRAYLQKSATPTDNVVLEIQTDSSGNPSGSVVGTIATVAAASLTTTLTQYTYSTSISLTQGTTYWFVSRRDGALDDVNFYAIGASPGAVSGWNFRKRFDSPTWIDGTSSLAVRLSTLTSGTLFLTNVQSGLSGAPALVSNFTGANENPLSEGGNWSILNSSGFACQRVSNVCRGSVSGAARSYWTPANFGPDLEAYVTMTLGSLEVGISFRVQGEGGAGTWDGYEIASRGTVVDFKVVTNATAVTTSLAGATWAAGDKLGVRVEGSTLQAWRQASGSSDWNLYATFVDSTYASAGKIGLFLNTSTPGIDDFFAATDSNLFTQQAWTSRGAGVVSYISDTDAGWVAPLYTQDWYTKQLTAFTLTGMAQANIRALESNASANASLRVEIARVDSDGTNPTVWGTWCIQGDTSTAGELTTSEIAYTAYVSGDDLAVSDGQRLRIRLYVEDIGVAALANAFNVQPFFNGTSAAASGDSYVTLAQSVTEFVAAGASDPTSWISERRTPRRRSMQRW